jgi:uncharacterized protein DUF6200
MADSLGDLRSPMSSAASNSVPTRYSQPDITAPIIISLGRKKKKAIKQLKRGKGNAMDEVMDVIAQVQENLGEQVADKIIVPIVVIYRRKQRRARGLFSV